MGEGNSFKFQFFLRIDVCCEKKPPIPTPPSPRCCNSSGFENGPNIITTTQSLNVTDWSSTWRGERRGDYSIYPKKALTRWGERGVHILVIGPKSAKVLSLEAGGGGYFKDMNTVFFLSEAWIFDSIIPLFPNSPLKSE